MKKFCPPLISRILLYLRQQRYCKKYVLTEELIERFDKSKSIISQALSFLTENQYVKKRYVSDLSNHGSRHRISIMANGLKIAKAILSEGLDPVKKKLLEALRIRSP